MIRRIGAIVALVAIVLAATGVPGGPVRPAAAAEYSLDTSAAYDIRPEDGEVGVTVQMTFTNTTPDPEGRFSVFP